MKAFINIILLIIASNSTLLSQDSKWTAIDSIRIYNHDSSATAAFFYEKIDCFDEMNCVAIGNLFATNPMNRVTTDGGHTWFTTLTDTSSFNYKDSVRYIPAIARSVVYPGKNLCIIGCDSGYYWRSTDYCKTWKRNKLPVAGDDYAVKKLNFSDEKKGVALDHEELFLTSDGGETWEKADLNFPDSLVHSYFSDVALIDENYIVLNISCFKTWKTRIYYSSDFGKNWNYYEPKVYQLNFIDFFDKNIGWAISSRRQDTNKNNYNDVIYKTEDGGKTWELQLDTLSFAYSYSLARIFFTDSLNGFALGYWYKLWRTSDGGKHWVVDEEYKNRITSDYFQDIYPFNKDYFFGITRYFAFIYKYENVTNYGKEELKQEVLNECSISPCPASDFIEISIPKNSHFLKEAVEVVRIYNVFGVEVSTPALRVTSQEENLKIDISGLPPGVYFVRVGAKVSKFVKM